MEINDAAVEYNDVILSHFTFLLIILHVINQWLTENVILKFLI